MSYSPLLDDHLSTDSYSEQWMKILSHELRTPLSAVVLALEVLRGTCQAEPTAREARDIAERGSRQIANIIEDLLNLSRASRGATLTAQHAVDIESVIACAVELAHPLVSDRRHQLHVSIEPRLPRICGQESRLIQVVTNLLTNAAKFTPPGGQIELTATVRDRKLEIDVVDNGIGISADTLPRVFEPYFRERTRILHTDGLGIGLTLVKQLVESHGGQISAHSDGIGVGAKFTVRLPLDWDRSAEHLAHSS